MHSLELRSAHMGPRFHRTTKSACTPVSKRRQQPATLKQFPSGCQIYRQQHTPSTTYPQCLDCLYHSRPRALLLHDQPPQDNHNSSAAHASAITTPVLFSAPNCLSGSALRTLFSAHLNRRLRPRSAMKRTSSACKSWLSRAAARPRLSWTTRAAHGQLLRLWILASTSSMCRHSGGMVWSGWAARSGLRGRMIRGRLTLGELPGIF